MDPGRQHKETTWAFDSHVNCGAGWRAVSHHDQSNLGRQNEAVSAIFGSGTATVTCQQALRRDDGRSRQDLLHRGCKGVV